MSTRRLAGTASVMALLAVLLDRLTPGWAAMAGRLADAQRVADTAGPDALVLCAAALTAWVVWAWGVLGLALTAASALPGVLGRAAVLSLRGVLPAAARRTAAAALGLGIAAAVPMVATASALMALPAAAADLSTTTAGAPDWPVTPAGRSAAGAPDWPGPPVADRSVGPADGAHVVVRGECLWHIARAALLEQRDTAPTDGDVATAVHAWWAANAAVIGPDSDLLLPGQVLRPPGPP